ncbi:MAG: hydroxymethylbilane synthase [Bacteroidota bacterium]
MKNNYTIGTRGSDLALWQARYIQQLLSQYNISSELKIIVTSGDKNQSWLSHFDKSEGKNFFTKEIEDALIQKEIDIAVHSFKDVDSSALDENNPLLIAGYTERHLPNDILILHPESVDKSKQLNIKLNTKIGTSSSRRAAQLKTLRPDIEILPLRGNVPTRIEKFKQHQYDGILLARAGVERLQINLNDFFVYPVPLHFLVPAAGQGIIAIQIRREDKDLHNIIQQFSNKESEICSSVERSIMNFIGGGCSVPIGVLCYQENQKYRLYISYTDNKEKDSILSILENESPESLINKGKSNVIKIQKFLQQTTYKKIFISKKLDASSYLRKIIKRFQWEIIDCPLIETQPLSITEIPDCDWIFFNSKNAVKYFFENNIDINWLGQKKIAAISDGTAQYLEKYGFSAHFIGSENNIQLTAQNFLNVCKNQKVLFPCSSISKKSIEKIIESQCNVIHFPIYKTIEKPVKIDDCNAYIFTSPSNVRAFFQVNTISSSSKIIAIGESTKKELEHFLNSTHHIHTPIAFDEMAITGLLVNVIEE